MMKYQDSAIDRDYVLLPFTCVGMHLFVMNPVHSKCLPRIFVFVLLPYERIECPVSQTPLSLSNVHLCKHMFMGYILC